MRLGIYLLLDSLVESDDSVSYCAFTSQIQVKKWNEGLTMNEKIDASFDGCDLSGGKHNSAGHLRFLPFALF